MKKYFDQFYNWVIRQLKPSEFKIRFFILVISYILLSASTCMMVTFLKKYGINVSYKETLLFTFSIYTVIISFIMFKAAVSDD